MKILIVGSEGFIGSFLYKRLSENYQVYTITKNNIDVLNTKAVTDYLKLIMPDIIINCLTFGGKEKVNNINSEDVGNNLRLLYNFYINQDSFKLFINIGSGAEFDRRQSIYFAKEHEIFINNPIDAYGFSKNLIARHIHNNKKFTTLRVFGCFGSTEQDTRLLKRYSSSENLILIDKYFDYISILDFYNILLYVIQNKIAGEDINCTYDEKITLSEFLSRYDAIYNRPKRYIVENFSEYSYIGDCDKLKKLDIPLLGINESLKKYHE